MSAFDVPLKSLSEPEFDVLRILLQLPPDEYGPPWIQLGEDPTVRVGRSAVGVAIFHRHMDGGTDQYSVSAHPENPIWITIMANRLTLSQTVLVRTDDEAIDQYVQFVRIWDAVDDQQLLLPPNTSSRVVVRAELVSFMLQFASPHGAFPCRLVESVVERAHVQVDLSGHRIHRRRFSRLLMRGTRRA